jgi:ketosteroid isomerase-like protein
MRTVSSAVWLPAIASIVVAGACSSRSATSSAGVAADSAARDRTLWAAESLRVGALVGNDTAALSRVYADEFTMVTSTGELRTKADQLREIGAGVLLHPSAGAPSASGTVANSSQSRPEAERVLSRRLYAGATVGVVVSENTAPVVRGADTATVRRRNTRVYVWRDGRWQLVSNHISRVAETAADGQSGAPPDSTAIAALEQRIENAVVAREIAFLDSAYTSDFRFKHSTGDLDTRAQWIASVQRSRFASRQVDSLDVEVHGDIAFTTGRLHVRRSPADPAWAKDVRWREYTVRYARVYVRRAGRWHLLTHHSTGESFGPLQ